MNINCDELLIIKSICFGGGLKNSFPIQIVTDKGLLNFDRKTFKEKLLENKGKF